MTELVRSEPVIQAAKVTKYFGEDCVLKEYRSKAFSKELHHFLTAQ